MDDGTSSVTFPESADSSPYILAHVGSYVPAGYIMLDHSPVNESSPYSKSVSSIWPKPPPRIIQSWNYLFWKTLRSAFFVQRSPRFGSNLFCLAFGEKKFSVCSLYMRRTFEMLPRGISSEPLKPFCTDIKYDNPQKLSLKPRQSGFRLRILLKNTSPSGVPCQVYVRSMQDFPVPTLFRNHIVSDCFYLSCVLMSNEL